MGNIVIKGISKRIYFSATNYYGANVKFSVYDDVAKEYIVQDVDMLEAVTEVEDFSAKVQGDTGAGENAITLDTVDGLAVNDRVSVDGSIYRVKKIDVDNKITELHRPLDGPVADGIDIARVGNMGVFAVELFLTRIGTFVLESKDDKFGLHKVDTITVKAQSLEDMFNVTTKEINENETILKSTSSFTIFI